MKITDSGHHVIGLLSADTHADAWQDWHRGRGRFGLWYIPIDEAAVAQLCQTARADLSALFADGYQRQWHITLWVVGFISDHDAKLDDEVSMADIEQMVDRLTALRDDGKLSPFILTLDKLDYFISTVHLSIKAHPMLIKIRTALGAVHAEISPSNYQPHITLGYFDQDYSISTVLDNLSGVNIQPMDLPVNRLIFGSYQADEMQGRLSQLVVVDLMDG